MYTEDERFQFLDKRTENINLSNKVLTWQIIIAMNMMFLIIEENEADNVFMMLDELFLASEIKVQYHKCFHDLKFLLLKIA